MTLPRLLGPASMFLVAAGLASGVVRADDPAPVASLVIQSLEGPNPQAFTAPEKPRALRLQKPVSWKKAPTSRGDYPEVWFTSAEGRRLTIELGFDGTRTATDVHATYAVPLMRLAMVRNPSATAPEDERRPARVKVTYGPIVFEGVVEDVAMQYTAFADSGSPRQGIATVRIREVSRATYKP